MKFTIALLCASLVAAAPIDTSSQDVNAQAIDSKGPGGRGGGGRGRGGNNGDNQWGRDFLSGLTNPGGWQNVSSHLSYRKSCCFKTLH